MNENVKTFLLSIRKPIFYWLLVGVTIFVLCFASAKLFSDTKDIAGMIAFLDAITAIFGIPLYLCFRLIHDLTKDTIQKILYLIWGVFAIFFGIIFLGIPLSTVNPNISGIMLETFIIASSVFFTFSVPTYLLYRFTKGTLRIILISLWSLACFSVILQSIYGKEISDNFKQIVSFIVSCFLLVFLARILLKNLSISEWLSKINLPKTSHSKSNSDTMPASAAPRPLAVLKGEHVCGLSANEGDKISVQLYDDKVSFLQDKRLLAQFDTADILAASSHSEEVITGTTTTARQGLGLASSVAIAKGDWAAAYLLRPRTTSYETKNKTDIYWYFVLDTTLNEVVIHVRSKDDLFRFVERCNDILFSLSSNDSDTLEDDIADTAENNVCEKNAANLSDIDQMNGPAFEQYCARLLEANGYTNVRVIGKAGDHGMDILAEKDGTKWGFQCKRWSQPVGNREVRDIVASNFHYKCDILVMVTNSTFTSNAKDYAESARVLLWDRAKLNELIYAMNHKK